MAVVEVRTGSPRVWIYSYLPVEGLRPHDHVEIEGEMYRVNQITLYAPGRVRVTVRRDTRWAQKDTEFDAFVGMGLRVKR